MLLSYNAAELIMSFEGLVGKVPNKPYYKAYLCPGNKWTIGLGCTYYPNGKAVKQDDLLHEKDVIPLFLHCLEEEFRPVYRALEVDLNQNQLDALCSFSFNTSSRDVVRSTLVRTINQGNLTSATDQMIRWTGTTRFSPTASQRKSQKLAPHIRGNHFVSPNGKPVPYLNRLPGLYRRRLAEACLWEGYDWREACNPNNIAFNTRISYDEGDERLEDGVDWANTTSLKSVIQNASAYPITTAEKVNHDDLIGLGPVGAIGKAISPNSRSHQELGYDPTKPVKPIEESERGIGFAWQHIGRKVVMKLGQAGTLGAGIIGTMAGAIAEDPELWGFVLAMGLAVSVAIGGWFLARYGDWKRARGEASASQPLG